MSKTELLQEGLNLMFVGMGFVLIFLFLLILAITLISKVVNRYFPEASPAVAAKPAQPAPAANDIELLRPVIAAAIAHHRRQQGLH